MKQRFTNNFDAVAAVYDRLGRLVFGKSQILAQADQLQHIPANSRVLIVGGGTGWILESIAALHHSGLQIVYVELSGKMLQRAKARNAAGNEVAFINADIAAYESGVKFDVVLTPFLFCNFLQDTARKVFMKLDALVKPGGLWLLTDFTTEAGGGRWWKTLLTKSMYLFFKSFGIVEGQALQDMAALFEAHHYLLQEERFYYGRFIFGAVYRKP